MNKNVCFSLDSQGINAHFLMSLTISFKIILFARMAKIKILTTPEGRGIFIAFNWKERGRASRH